MSRFPSLSKSTTTIGPTGAARCTGARNRPNAGVGSGVGAAVGPTDGRTVGGSDGATVRGGIVAVVEEDGVGALAHPAAMPALMTESGRSLQVRHRLNSKALTIDIAAST